MNKTPFLSDKLHVFLFLFFKRFLTTNSSIFRSTIDQCSWRLSQRSRSTKMWWTVTCLWYGNRTIIKAARNFIKKPRFNGTSRKGLSTHPIILYQSEIHLKRKTNSIHPWIGLPTKKANIHSSVDKKTVLSCFHSNKLRKRKSAESLMFCRKISPKDRQSHVESIDLTGLLLDSLICRRTAGVLVALNYWHHSALKSAQYHRNMRKKAYKRFNNLCYRLVNFV